MTENIDASSAPQVGGASQSTVATNYALLTMTRYLAGYLQAREINSLGTFIKTFAWIVGGLMAVVPVVSCVSVMPYASELQEIVTMATFLASIVVVVVGHVLSKLVRAAGVLLKAQLDCAVNGSPFLNDDQRAEVMSLK